MGAPGPEAFSDDLLERVTLHQATRGFHRLVVLFVERWAVVREPTLPAQLALAEAYVHLRLLDRAYSRVEGVLDRSHATAAMWRLAVEILRMRGWLDQATALARRAEHAFPDDASITVLVDTASRPWLPPSPPAGDTVGAAIAHAEKAMVEGKFVRAQVELQRVRRGLSRPNGRIDELLWAIRGDFTMDAGIEQLVPLLLPSPDASDTLVPIEDDALGGPASAEAFRQLYENLDVEEGDFELDEPTHITEMAAIVRSAGGNLDSDSPTASPPSEADTIMNAPGPQPTGTDALETMMEGTLGDGQSDYVRPDHLEDDAIVVVTRQESRREPAITEPFAAEVAKVTQDVRREARAHEVLADVPVERFLHPTPPPAPPRWSELLRERIVEEGRSGAFWAGGAAVLLVFGVGLLAVAAWIALN